MQSLLSNHFKTLSEIPVSASLSDAISKDMKKQGIQILRHNHLLCLFAGVELVNDHLVDFHCRKS